jgi:propanol-preferring alcohol dehydrogenase
LAHGHLAIKFANKTGFRITAIAMGKDKENMVKRLGRALYVDNNSQNVIEELVKHGFVTKMILSTAPCKKR